MRMVGSAWFVAKYPRHCGARKRQDYSGRQAPYRQRRLSLLNPPYGHARHTLSIEDHSRDSAGMRYVYPVVSRRAGGVSIGINLNPNNACNWRCIYCQVPDLTRGGPPPIDLALLDGSLSASWAGPSTAISWRRMCRPGARRLVDLAFSGNGEPTSAASLTRAVELVVSASACPRSRRRSCRCA
jgi:hypothetical protein